MLVDNFSSMIVILRNVCINFFELTAKFWKPIKYDDDDNNEIIENSVKSIHFNSEYRLVSLCSNRAEEIRM